MCVFGFLYVLVNFKFEFDNFYYWYIIMNFSEVLKFFEINLKRICRDIFKLYGVSIVFEVWFVMDSCGEDLWWFRIFFLRKKKKILWFRLGWFKGEEMN